MKNSHFNRTPLYELIELTRTMSKFGPAHAAQILRAEQKDDNFVGKLTKEMSQLLLTAMGPANLIKWQQFIEPTARYVLIFQSIKH